MLYEWHDTPPRHLLEIFISIKEIVFPLDSIQGCFSLNLDEAPVFIVRLIALNKLAATFLNDIHAKFEFAHTSEIEGMFGIYRTFVRRMYHHHWSINLEEYVREFCFRFSSPELFENPIYYLTKSLSLAPID